MNLRDYKYEIENIDRYEEKLNSFKININNQLLRFKEDKECAEAGAYNGIPLYEWDPEDQEEFIDNWAFVGSSIVENLFTAMEWDFGMVSQNKKITRSDVMGDIYYFDYQFYDIEKYLLDCDNVDFFYAMVILANSLSDRYELGKRIISMTNQALLLNGLRDIQQQIIKGKLKPKVFIAMSFSNSMRSAGNNIEKAISDAGYEPILLLDKQYNGQIVPEIIYEIKSCQFVVADFTENKSNVYYEVGYATALGKEVIVTVKKDHLKKVSFDTNQLHHVVWNDEDDLKDRLYNRIVKTVGAY